jgi:hypothetical protein
MMENSNDHDRAGFPWHLLLASFMLVLAVLMAIELFRWP